MQLNPRTISAAAAILMLAMTPAPALAYMGPGLGLGAIGTALGLVGAVLLGLFSVLWYPCKRLVRRLRRRQRVDALPNSLDVRKPRR
jgi:hypothetical protein